MENQKKSNNVLLIILVILVLGLGGFIVYDKVLKDNKPTEEIDVNNNLSNSYELFAKNLKSQFSKYDINNKNYLSVDSVIVGSFEVYLTEEQDLIINYSNKELDDIFGNYKIADHVLSFNIISTGQGGGHTLYFINEDGTVGSADIEYWVTERKQIQVKKDLGFKNIVNITGGTFGEYSGARAPIFIDINGNIFSENLK